MAAESNDSQQRELAILEEIIHFYMDKHEAISARTLSKISRLALSPTTIRNLMEDLSAEGFLTNEGVTRGRIPTQKAFAIYVTRLDEQRQPPPARAPEISAMEEGRPALMDTVLEEIGAYLAEHTACAVSVVLPKRDHYPLNWARFAEIPGGQARPRGCPSRTAHRGRSAWAPRRIRCRRSGRKGRRRGPDRSAPDP